MRAALEVAHAALEGQATDMAAAQRALAELDAASDERKAEADALRGENLGLQAQQAVYVAALDSATKQTDALRRALEEKTADLLSARQALADRNAAATAAEAAAAVAVAAAATATASQRKAAGQAKQAAESAALATMDDLAAMLLELERWRVELAADQGYARTRTAERGGGQGLPGEGHTSMTESKSKIKSQIDAGIKRQDLKVVEEAFHRFEKDCQVITKQQYILLLEEFGLFKTVDDVEALFRSPGVIRDGGLVWEEFKSVALVPSTVEQMIKTLPLSQLIADAMLIEKGKDPLRALSEISPEQVKDSCSVVMPYLEKVLDDAVRRLKVSFELMESLETGKGAGKFEVPAEMSAGTVQDFFGGLHARIGTYSVYISSLQCMD